MAGEKVKVMIGLNGKSSALGAKETRMETTASVWKLEGGAGENVKGMIGWNGRSSALRAGKKK